jgi:hypothetical protein
MRATPGENEDVVRSAGWRGGFGRDGLGWCGFRVRPGDRRIAEGEPREETSRTAPHNGRETEAGEDVEHSGS